MIAASTAGPVCASSRATTAGGSDPALNQRAIDQTVHRDGPVDVDRQHGEDAPLPGVSNVDAAPVEPDLDVAE